MSRAVAMSALLLAACGSVGGGDAPPSREAVEIAPCRVSGCSSQVCSAEEVVTTCEWLDEYACYRGARCEPQPDGGCGWTETPELLACIERARAE